MSRQVDTKMKFIFDMKMMTNGKHEAISSIKCCVGSLNIRGEMLCELSLLLPFVWWCYKYCNSKTPFVFIVPTKQARVQPVG